MATEYSVEREIAAPVERVWAPLSDSSSYGRRNLRQREPIDVGVQERVRTGGRPGDVVGAGAEGFIGDDPVRVAAVMPTG